MQFSNCIVYYNPAAGRNSRNKINRLIDEMELREWNVVVVATQHAGHLKKILAEQDVSNDTLLVVSGGDGTLNEAVNGIMCNPNGEQALLAVYPTGTVNLLAKEFGLRTAPKAYCDFLQQATPREIFPASVNERWFIVTLGVGFDGWVVSKVNRTWKKRLSVGAYAWWASRLWLQGWRRTWQVKVKNTRQRAAGVIVMNGKYYGGKFAPVPEAASERRGFYTCTYKGSSRLSLLRYAGAMAAGKLATLADVNVKWSDTMVVAGEGETALQVDGDSVIMQLPLMVKAAEWPLKMLI